MKFIKNVMIASTIVLAFSSAASATVTYTTASDGTLLGAKGVQVGSSFYDVTFGDGLVKDGITAFTTATDARLASQALIDQVLTGNYSMLRLKTNGCTSSSQCGVYTPFAATTLTSGAPGTAFDAIFMIPGYKPLIGGRTNDLTASTTERNYATLAYWTPAVANAMTPVPEAETFAMLLSGVGLLGFVTRRKQKMV